MNCDFCGTDTGINGMDLKDGGHSHYSSSSCAQSLKEQRERLLLQLSEAKALLQRFLDAGPEEEYEVILCKLSGDVEKFLEAK